MIIHRPRQQTDQYYSPRAKDYSHAYLSILRASRARSIGSSSSSAAAAVLILVSPDVDALCAARLFARLLRDDDVPHRVVPVDGYRTLASVVQEDVVGNEELHSVLFLNLGSVLSLPAYFTTSLDEEGRYPLPPSCTLHVLDSHRPWNLDNLFATSEMMEKQICVWDDGEIVERLRAEAQAYEALEFDVGSDDESDSESEGESEQSQSEEDEEEEDGDGDGSGSGSENESRAKGKRKRRSRTSDGSDGSDDGATTAERKRKSKRSKRIRSEKPAKLSSSARQMHRAVLERYYMRGTTTGMSVSGMMYTLAEKLGRNDNDALWLAILGLTSQYLASTIHYETYDQYSSAFASDVIAMNPVPPDADDEGDAKGRGRSDGRPLSADDAHIRVVQTELRFTLYRHWSLEHSMYHTSYVAAKLGIWREKGISKLRVLLAKMGFSLQNCRQTYEHMDLDLRKTLVQRMESMAPEEGLTELVYRSFIRSFGFRGAPLSAADAVEGIDALLNAAHGVRIDVELAGMNFAAVNSRAGAGSGLGGNYGAPGSGAGSELFGTKRPWNLGGIGQEAHVDKENVPLRGQGPEAEEELAKKKAEWDRNEAWKASFHAAYAALDSRRAASVAIMRQSLALAKSLHTAIISQGVSLLDKQEIRMLSAFRLAIIKDGADLHLFTQPGILTRLALWLVDALRDNIVEADARRAAAKKAKRRARRSKTAQAEEEDENENEGQTKNIPFVLAALDEHADTYIVVGVTGAPDFGDTRRNRFGLAFQEAASASGARTRHDRFETAAIEVKRADLAEFISALHSNA